MANELKEKPVIFKADSVRAIIEGRKTQTRRVITRENSRFWSPLEPGERWKADQEFWDKLCWDEKNEEVRLSDDGMSVIYDWDGDGVWRRLKPTWEVGQLLWGREAFWAQHDTESRDYAEPLDCGPNLGEGFYESGLESYVQFCATPDNAGCPNEPGDYWEPPTEEEKKQFGEGEDWPKWIPWSHYSKQSPLFMPKWASRLWLRVTSFRAERLNDISIGDALSEGLEAEECTHLGAGPYGCTDCMNTGLLEDPRWGFEHLWDEINGKRGFPWKDNPWVWVFTFERAKQPNLWPKRKPETCKAG
jgi:hypothetical protein